MLIKIWEQFHLHVLFEFLINSLTFGLKELLQFRHTSKLLWNSLFTIWLLIHWDFTSMNYETFCCGTKANTTVTKILQQKKNKQKQRIAAFGIFLAAWCLILHKKENATKVISTTIKYFLFSMWLNVI